MPSSKSSLLAPLAIALALSACAPEPGEAAQVAAGVPPADWPSHRGNPQQLGVAAGSLRAKPTLAWKFKTDSEVLASPVVHDGTVYVGSTDNVFYAIDLATGEERWRHATDDMIEGPALVRDGAVYFGSTDFFLYALDAKTGERRWRYETNEKIAGAPNWFRTAAGKTHIVVGSYDASVYCLDTKGQEVWTYVTGDRVNGTPAIANGEVVFGGCDAALHLVSAETGKGVAKVELERDHHIAGSAALADDRAFFGHYGNQFVCVDLESGEDVWSYPSPRDAFFSSPSIGEDRVVFGGRDRKLHCVGRADGKPLWAFKTRRRVDGSPVICGDKVVFGSGDGRLYLLGLEKGDELWRYELGRSLVSSPAVAGGMIVIGSTDHHVYAFDAKPE